MPAYTIESARNSKSDERFGYETRGCFRCTYSTEKFYMILIAVLYAVGMFGIATGMMALFSHGEEEALMCAICILVLWIVWTSAGAVVFRLLMYGSEYRYSADDDKMTIRHGSNSMDIFYYNVLSVRYEPLELFRKQRGFIVTVVTRKSTNVFRMVYCRSDARMAKENTPFAILEERAELNKPSDPDLVVRYRQEHMTDRERALEAGMLERPELRSMEQMKANVEPNISYVQSEDDFIIAKGRFHVPHKYEMVIIVLLLAMCLLCMVGLVIAGAIIGDPLIIMLFIVPPLVFVAVTKMVVREEYTYIADGREFRITDKKGKTETIYFCDVESVEYTPLKLLWVHRGYKVDIITKYRTITYNCLFLLNKKLQSTHELPFALIEQKIAASKVSS